MVQTLELQLFRLSNLRGNWLEAQLTPEEASKLSEPRNGLYSTHNLGYFDPKRVERYFVEELDRVIEGSPIPVILIRPEDEWEHRNFIGTYILDHKEGDKTYGVLFSPVMKGDQIDVAYVADDESGKFVPVTREKVESEIAESYRQIDEGHGADLRRVRVLAKASGLDFAEEIERLRIYRDETYFRHYNSPEHLRELIPELAQRVGDYASLEHIGESGLGEDLREFFGLLPRLTIPEDIAPDVDRIKTNYLRAYDRAVEDEQDKIKESQERIEALTARKAQLRQQLIYVPVPEQLSLDSSS